MPPLQPGVPGDGHGEDDHDEDHVGYTPPLPPEDRLWRHPSEVASGRPAHAPGPARQGLDRRIASLMLLSGMVGATLAVAGVALLGGFRERVIERPVTVATSLPDDGVQAVARRTGPSVAALLVHRGAEQAHASAVVLDGDGHLVTDGPSVAGADEIDVVLHDGQAGAARLVGIDDVTGIAVLHLDAALAPPVLADAPEPVEVGARTIAVGASPDGGWDITVSTGVVAAVGRRLDLGDGGTRHGMIVVDKPFAPGTGGGALVGLDGVVVGIVSGAGAEGGGGLGVATPIDLARHVADQLITHGRAQHVWLGLHGTDLDADEAMAMGIEGGALVEDADADGPARRAGIRPGDVIVAVDERSTPTMSALIATLRRHVPGDVVVLRVHRGDQIRSLRVTLAAKA